MNNVFVRQAREEDAKNFTEWFVKMPSFTKEIFEFPETYILCAFNPSILGYGVVCAGHGVQVLSRMVLKPQATDLEKALASKEMVKTVITLGYMNQLDEIYFVGDNPGTNRIAQHTFKEIPYEEYKDIFGISCYPIYRLRLEELENGRY